MSSGNVYSRRRRENSIMPNTNPSSSTDVDIIGSINGLRDDLAIIYNENETEIKKIKSKIHRYISDQNGKSNTTSGEISAIQRQVSKLDGFEQTVLSSLRDIGTSNNQTRDAVNSAIPMIVSLENKYSSLSSTLTWILVIVIIILFIVLVALIIWIIVLLVRRDDDKNRDRKIE